ncbi:MAG: c-type cytochrome [Candidatus Sulfotelmatobacter sp.]
MLLLLVIFPDAPLSGRMFRTGSPLLGNPAQAVQRKQATDSIAARSARIFASTCAGCHGLDGRGGERAPNIVDSPKVQRLSDAQISEIIENGILGTGMPAFHSLESSDVQSLVAYLRTLQGTKGRVKLPGDPSHGETVFFGKAGCSGCHMVAGKGGFIASDLSAYARTHGVEQIRSAITNAALNSAGLNNAGLNNDRQARLVTVTIRGGEKYTGRIRNEDNFSLQLQTLDGAFHFLSKSDIEALEYSSQAMMPADYSSTLTSNELNDVVSYLMSVANARTNSSETPRDESGENED